MSVEKLETWPHLLISEFRALCVCMTECRFRFETRHTTEKKKDWASATCFIDDTLVARQLPFAQWERSKVLYCLVILRTPGGKPFKIYTRSRIKHSLGEVVNAILAKSSLHDVSSFRTTNFNMSYYSSYSSSASLLDPYCAGGRYHSSVVADSPYDRRDNLYSSTYSSTYGNIGNDYTSSSSTSASASSRRPSAFDRYVSYLSDELAPRAESSTRRWASPDLISDWNRKLISEKFWAILLHKHRLASIQFLPMVSSNFLDISDETKTSLT